MIHEPDPCEYFLRVHLLESELVRFRMRSSISQLDIVVIYAAEAIGAYFKYLHEGGSPTNYKVESVDFRLLRFLGVDRMRTRLGTNVSSVRSPEGNSDVQWEQHEKSLLPMRRLITNVDCKRCSSEFKCLMYFDSFGEHSWVFQQLLTDRRLTYVLQDGSGIKYKDVSTGAIIDPSNPFADQMAGI